MNIYNQEVLELKKEILLEISNELKDIVNFKIKTNTKAYSELKNTISQWDLNERIGDLDIKNLFSIVDITEEVQNRQYQIPFNIEQMDLMLKDEMPNIDIGTHCSNPYSCDFESHCWEHIPNPSVFNLYWMNGSKKFEMYYKGIVNYEDIPLDFALNTTQKL